MNKLQSQTKIRRRQNSSKIQLIYLRIRGKK